jgi:uncharacterized protein
MKRKSHERAFCSGLAAWALAASVVHAGGVADTSKSPHAKLRSVELGDVRWTQGYWAEKQALCRTAMVPAVQNALLDPRNSEHLVNFRIAAGLEPGEHRSTDWSDGDCYKWLEAVSLVYEVTKAPVLDRLLDDWIDVIGKAQRADGFISTNAQLRKDRQPLDVPYTHQLYNMGHLLTAACVHHRATGKGNFLRIATKTADFLDRQFRSRPPRLTHFPWNPSAYMGLVEMYRTTRERRYLTLAGLMIDNRGSSPGGNHVNGGTDQTQDRNPIRKETQAVGHAVCAMYLYCGATDLYLETGEEPLRTALERIWRNVTSRQMYITGAVGAGGGQSFRGDPVHEAFLGDYQLPHPGYAETCSNIGNAMWNYRLLAATGEARYADIVERVLYNSVLSAVSIDGKSFFYCNPLVWDGTAGQGHHFGRRWTTECDCYCCPPSVARTVAQIHNWAYSVSEDGVWIHLYGGSKLKTRLPDGSTVGLTQQTNYPWDGRITITVDQAPKLPIGILLRIPDWAEAAAAKVNGKPAGQTLKSGSYAVLRRTWKPGDVVEIELPMPVRLIEAHPAVVGLENRVAVMRGPLVYCVEAPLEQGGRQIWKNGVFLSEDVHFTPRHDPNLLGGITVLEGKALTFEGRDRFVREVTSDAKPPEQRKDWEGVLYRNLQPLRTKPAKKSTVPITLIPYYAWANRGLSYMEVWIPLAR